MDTPDGAGTPLRPSSIQTIASIAPSHRDADTQSINLPGGVRFNVTGGVHFNITGDVIQHTPRNTRPSTPETIREKPSSLMTGGLPPAAPEIHINHPYQQRPTVNRAATSRATVPTAGSRSMPALRRKETRLAQKEAHPWQHLGITAGLPMILLFDLIIPIIIYYTWYNRQVRRTKAQCEEFYNGQSCPLETIDFEEEITGIAVACFGFGELWILIARVWRLIFRHAECAPLLSRARWELDATSWVYGIAMILALIPFVTGSSLIIPKLYLYGPTFIMGFLGLLMLITIVFPFTLPTGINSQPRGTKLRPFIYYAAEDFIAVDGLQDREFRVRFNERYETNAMFRQFFVSLTLWWMLGVAVYIGAVSAVIFTLPFHHAFGLSLGVLFGYIAAWAAVTWYWVKVEMRRQSRAFEEAYNGV